MDPDEAFFSRKGLSCDRLRSFLAVVDAGGFARAAPRQPVRQSQLSRQVAELEAFFERKLLERRGRGVHPTEAGAALAVHVRELLRGLRDVASRPADEVMELRFGAGDSLLNWWVVARLGTLLTGEATERPQLQLVFTAYSSNDVERGLRSAELDVGIVRGKPQGLRTRPLGRLGHALFVPRRLAGRGQSTQRILADVPLVLQRGEPAVSERALASARALGVSPRIAAWCETFPQAAAAVRSGSCAAVLPTLAKSDLPADVAVLELPGLARFEVSLHLAWHARLDRMPQARALGSLEAALRLHHGGRARTSDAVHASSNK